MVTSDHSPGDDVGAHVKETWSKVGDNFVGLSALLKQHYQSHSDVPPEAKEKVSEALNSLGEAIDQATEAIGDAVRDPSVKESASAAGSSVLDAISDTLDEVAGNLTSRWRRRMGGSGS
jgi:hypothetical protein